MNSRPLIKESLFNTPPAKVWQAITDREQMKHWYFDLADFKADVGFQFRFEGGPDGRTYLHLCEVTEVIPGKKLTYSWRYDGYPGNSVVTWELFEDRAGTRLKLTHAGLETFPADNPDLAASNFVAGWDEIIGNSLKNFLEKKQE